jgi:hypothetical protein
LKEPEKEGLTLSCLPFPSIPLSSLTAVTPDLQSSYFFAPRRKISRSDATDITEVRRHVNRVGAVGQIVTKRTHPGRLLCVQLPTGPINVEAWPSSQGLGPKEIFVDLCLFCFCFVLLKSLPVMPV